MHETWGKGQHIYIYAAVTDVQTKPSKEECARSMGQRSSNVAERVHNKVVK